MRMSKKNIKITSMLYKNVYAYNEDPFLHFGYAILKIDIENHRASNSSASLTTNNTKVPKRLPEWQCPIR